MYGLNIRELAVYEQTLSGSRRLLWRLNGEHEDAWKFASVPLRIPKGKAVKVKWNCHFNISRSWVGILFDVYWYVSNTKPNLQKAETPNKL